MAYGTLKSDVMQSSTAGTPPQFNDGNGTQVGTLCRTWVNFNGTTSTIRASFNVGSLTKNGTGDYTVNFSNALIDANYSVAATGAQNSAGNNISIGLNPSTAKTSSAVRVYQVSASFSAVDSADISVSVFR